MSLECERCRLLWMSPRGYELADAYRHLYGDEGHDWKRVQIEQKPDYIKATIE